MMVTKRHALVEQVAACEQSSRLMGMAAHRAQEQIDLECANIFGAAVDLKAFRRDGDFLM
jgi:hypothetical protein